MGRRTEWSSGVQLGTMKTLGTVLLAALVVATLSAGCVTREVAIGAADNGREIVLERGQTLAVALEANPTTGYNWLLVGEPPVEILSVVGEEFAAPGEDRVGAGGVTTWRFRAVGEGRTAIELGYARSWEEGLQPLEAFRIQVVVP